MMRTILFLGLSLLGLLGFMAPAAAVTVEGIRVWQSPDSLRVVLDVSGPVQYSSFTLTGPDRLVIDIEQGATQVALDKLPLRNTWVQAIRRSTPEKQASLRLVLDLKRPIEPKSFTLTPYQQYGHRLVFDLMDSAPVAKPYVPEPVPSPAVANAPVSATPASGTTPPPAPHPRRKSSDKLIISIDAGHGGDDPGAIGPTGAREKDVNLAISKRLAELINQQPGMEARLVRTGDYFIPLHQRVQIARKHKADMFVSIHSDGFTDPRANGASVWVLSNHGATSEMGVWLERLENSSDLLGGIGNLSLQDKDPVLAEVLLDLSMTHSREASRVVAEKVLEGLGRATRLHKNQVQYAGFRVLKSPDIPSILVESAFISNPNEERKLQSREYQTQVASAVLDGIKTYFSQHPRAGSAPTQLAAASPATVRRHKVQAGDTLSAVARQYGTSMSAIKQLNQMRSDTVRIGQVLRIP